MSGEVVAAVQTFLEWIKTPWKLFVILFAISLFALFVPRSWLQTIGMTAWVQHFWPWLVVTFAFSGLFLVITTIEEAAKPIIQRRKNKRSVEANKSKLESTFRSLVSDEINVLSEFSGGHSTITARSNHGTVHNLAKKGILHCVTPGQYYESYSLTEEVMSYLAENHLESVGVAITKAKL